MAELRLRAGLDTRATFVVVYLAKALDLGGDRPRVRGGHNVVPVRVELCIVCPVSRSPRLPAMSGLASPAHLRQRRTPGQRSPVSSELSHDDDDVEFSSPVRDT